MSESTIPFQGQTAVLDRPPVDLGPEEPQRGGDRTKLLAMVAVAVVLVMGAAAYFLLFAGGEEATSPAAPKQPAAAPPAPVEEPAATPAKKERLTAKTFGRDPFKALIVAPEAAVATGEVPVGSAAPVGGAPAQGSTPETSTPASSTAHSFRVVDVAPDNSAVTVKVDGKFYRNLKAGDVFAKYFKVVLISGQVNSFQYGEEKFNVIGTKRLTIA
ncbi:MAG: hypothetical protein ACRDWY_02065 [Actinomycetes bacterium]